MVQLGEPEHGFRRQCVVCLLHAGILSVVPLRALIIYYRLGNLNMVSDASAWYVCFMLEYYRPCRYEL